MSLPPAARRTGSVCVPPTTTLAIIDIITATRLPSAIGARRWSPDLGRFEEDRECAVAAVATVARETILHQFYEEEWASSLPPD
ncbi:unnamed protein product [Hydatigera taeniaeformis]|uniref:Uncharacterized protein n=1 Tax=Hydatigena taeniaeformis TaxID=6205 RepID=A0A0R3WZ72_HYDTA|nr:unnamed protein product [Hydatigera taeniaeformis]